MIKLDLKDRKLLYWLDLDSRATNKGLGKKVALTEQAIGYRIKRLYEREIIRGFVTLINFQKLGFSQYRVFVKLHNILEEVEHKITVLLFTNPYVNLVEFTSGRYDIIFSILARTPSQFSTVYQDLESKFGQYIIEKHIVLAVRSLRFTREFLIGKSLSNKIEYESDSEIIELDDTNKKILKSISQHANKNITEIAKEISSTVDIVKYRIKRLKQKRIINGFTVILNSNKIGYEQYLVLFSAHNHSQKIEEKMIGFCQTIPNIVSVEKVIGSHDLQIFLEVKNYEELETNFKIFRQRFADNIKDFEILRVTKEFKYTFFPFEVEGMQVLDLRKKRKQLIPHLA